MKKVLGIMIAVILLTVAAIAAASEETIMRNHVYDFVANGHKEFEIFNKLEDGEYYIENGVLYQWSTSGYLDEEFINMSFKEIENWLIEKCHEYGIPHVDAHLHQAGVDVIWLELNAMSDLNNTEIITKDFGEPIYAVSMIAWRDYEHMH